MAESLTHSGFASSLDTPFQLQFAPNQTLVLNLVRVSERRVSARDESFSILLRGPSAPLLPQATYTFEHAEMGTFALFIVPVERDQNGLYYEAVFTTLLKGE